MSLYDHDPGLVLNKFVGLLIRVVLLVPLFAYCGLIVGDELAKSYLLIAPDYFLSTVRVASLYLEHPEYGDVRHWANKFGSGDMTIAAAFWGAYSGFVLAIALTLKRNRIMHALRWILIVLTTTLVGGLLGAVVGYLLGANVPDYYRGVFPAGKETWFNPTQVGIGLGTSQGLAAGVVIGGFLVLADAWLLSRKMIHSVANPS